MAGRAGRRPSAQDQQRHARGLLVVTMVLVVALLGGVGVLSALVVAGAVSAVLVWAVARLTVGESQRGANGPSGMM